MKKYRMAEINLMRVIYEIMDSNDTFEMKQTDLAVLCGYAKSGCKEIGWALNAFCLEGRLTRLGQSKYKVEF